MSRDKIRSEPDAIAWRRKVKGQVVFTNGVFDIVHAGHVDLLERAGRLGAVLVVGVNDDSSARGLDKGPGRPINTLEDRAAVLAAMSAVDCVVAFSEDTPEALIEMLRPEILVKGDDYEMDELPGRKFVESIGGRVVLLPMTVGHSTTKIVERIRGSG